MKLDFDAQVLCDSVAPNGVRLTTVILTYPRFIHAELMTHRVFSRNAASSRAIPVKKKVARILEHMVEPVEWGVNKPGMSATEVLTPEMEMLARSKWHAAGKAAIFYAQVLDGVICARCVSDVEHENPELKCQCPEGPIVLKVHKQVANRILEPFDWMVTIVSSTKWRNWDILRMDGAADPNIQKLAKMCFAAREVSVPKFLQVGEWHLPFIEASELAEWGLAKAKQVSGGRCARLSYLTHEGKRDPEEDVKLFHRLVTRAEGSLEPGHWTPVEHQATPIGGFELTTFQESYDCCCWCGQGYGAGAKAVFMLKQSQVVCINCALGHITSGNFHGWTQQRKEFPMETFDA